VIKLSKHIADEMGGRGITLAYIETAISLPDRVAADASDPSLTRSYKSIAAFGGRMLRVVHRPEGADIFVVTAHWDRGARR
jgi:hypothetical protein